MTKPLIQPLVNINGTERRDLCLQQVDVLDAIDNLLTVMGKAMPHGRDYQPDPPKFSEARQAWEQRMKLVALLRSEIANHAEKMVAAAFTADRKH